MTRRWIVALLFLAACEPATSPTPPSTPTVTPGSTRVLQGALVHIARLPAATPALVQASSPISYHGGLVLPVTKVAAIYWGTSPIYLNGPTPGTSGAGAGDGSLIGFFLGHLGGSEYFNINASYYDFSGTIGNSVRDSVIYSRYWASNTNVPPSDGTPVSNTTIQNQIIAGFNSGNLTYDPQAVYAVFTAGNTNLGGGFRTSYCAYHGKFTWNSKTVIYAAMPYNAAGGCGGGFISPNNDLPADLEINTLAHEIEEATTDYNLDAWYDGNGDENADKCAWNFGTTYTTSNGGTANMKIGTRDFLIQQNWINKGAGACAIGLGFRIANGGLSGNCGQLCTSGELVSISASGTTVTLRDNGGHTGTLLLVGATASGSFTASCGQLCSGAAITSITGSGSSLTVRDNSGHSGTIQLTGATASGGFAASCGATCGQPGVHSLLGTGTNLLSLNDNFNHKGRILLAP
jgi:hypothetical protein